MSAFKDMLKRDVNNTFLSLNDFADKRTIIVDDAVFEDVSVVMSGAKDKERRQLVSAGDHTQGLYLVSSVLHCSVDDLGGIQPEKGQRIRISDADSNNGYFNSYYVASSVCEEGMLRIELEAIDE